MNLKDILNRAKFEVIPDKEDMRQKIFLAAEIIGDEGAVHAAGSSNLFYGNRAEGVMGKKQRRCLKNFISTAGNSVLVCHNLDTSDTGNF